MSPLGLRTIGKRVPGLGRLGGQSAPKNHYMVFVDSENLVSQFQSMKADGKIPLQGDNIFYKPNSYLWTPMQFIPNSEISLANFYVVFSGGEKKREEIVKEIESFPISANIPGKNHFNPIMIGKKTEGTFQKISFDIGQCSGEYPLTICLFSGNGEYFPVLQNAKNENKQIRIFAFSKGLNPELKDIASSPVCILDDLFFTPS